MKLIYIAHPFAGDGSPEWGNEKRNIERYLRFVAFAMEQGHCVVSWIHHIMIRRRDIAPDEPAYYLERDMHLIDRCDEVWCCAPMETSSGMQRERTHSTCRGIHVVQRPEWLDPEYMPPLKYFSGHDTQPPPVPGEGPAVWDAVIEDMRDRDNTGFQRYGTRLRPHNGRDALRDAYEESLDLAVYLKQAMMERSS